MLKNVAVFVLILQIESATASTNLGEPGCSKDYDCKSGSGGPYSLCVNGTCICINGTYDNNGGNYGGVCKRVIGASCSDETYCGNVDANAECTGTGGSLTCACKPGYFGDGGDICETVLETSCSDETNCGDVDTNAECVGSNGFGTCVCKAGYVGGKGEACTAETTTALTTKADTETTMTPTSSSTTAADMSSNSPPPASLTTSTALEHSTEHMSSTLTSVTTDMNSTAEFQSGAGENNDASNCSVFLVAIFSIIVTAVVFRI